MIVRVRMATIAAWASFVLTLLAAVDATADPCTSRCTKAFQICASGRAAGCEVGGNAVGDLAADALGNALPIPGLGDIFGSAAAELTAAECTKLLLPCEDIRKTCLAECPASAGAPGSSATGPPPPPKKLGTLRIFSDKPNTRVYLNEKRMGATPANPEQPFVSPQVPVGHYLVRLITPDGVWGWEGKGQVEEGNINALEANLVNLMEKLWQSAKQADQSGALGHALAGYQRFVKEFAQDTNRVSAAQERIAALTPQVAAAQKALWGKIAPLWMAAPGPEEDKLLGLLEQYLDTFPGGPRRPEATEELTRRKRRQKTHFRSGCGPSPSGKGGPMCFLPGGTFQMGSADTTN